MAENIYKNPIFLNSLAHKSVQIAPVADYSFARSLNSVLLVGQEFIEAAKHYPVVFTKGQNEEIVSLAIMGLRNDENLFIDDEGKWKTGVYVPAYIRRYPFILADNVGQDGSFAVCVDSAYEGFDRGEGMFLFDRGGEQTPEFKSTVEFLRNYQTQYELTKTLIKHLKDYDLFKDVSANITTPLGEKISFAGLMMIDEEAILRLEDEKIVNLVRTGFLPWVYAHLYSLSNFRALTAL